MFIREYAVTQWFEALRLQAEKVAGLIPDGVTGLSGLIVPAAL